MQQYSLLELSSFFWMHSSLAFRLFIGLVAHSYKWVLWHLVFKEKLYTIFGIEMWVSIPKPVNVIEYIC